MNRVRYTRKKKRPSLYTYKRGINPSACQFNIAPHTVNMEPGRHTAPYREEEISAKIQVLNVFLATIEVESAMLMMRDSEKKQPDEEPTKRKIKP